MEQEKKQPDVRLIGLDLDGTTLTSDKVLTPHTKEVLEKCLAERIQVLQATGSVRSGIPEYITQIAGMSEEDFIKYLGNNNISIFSFDDEAEFIEEMNNA